MSMKKQAKKVFGRAIRRETEQQLEQWFPTCGTRTTSGTRRSYRWYASTFCLLLDRREFLVQAGLILSFLEPSTLSRSVIPKLCAATDSQVFRKAFWKKTMEILKIRHADKHTRLKSALTASIADK